MNPNSVVLRDVLRAVPVGIDDAIDRRSVHAAVACWAPTSIKHALRDLRNAGQVQSVGEGAQRRYWREAA